MPSIKGIFDLTEQHAQHALGHQFHLQWRAAWKANSLESFNLHLPACYHNSADLWELHCITQVSGASLQLDEITCIRSTFLQSE